MVRSLVAAEDVDESLRTVMGVEGILVGRIVEFIGI